MRIKLETIVGLFVVVSITIFLFISFKIGIWRFDTIRYVNYISYFSDVSGVNEKADVMVAGVKVGWVNKSTLVSRNKQVRLDLMVDRNSIIYANAYAVVRQNGLLGAKYIEIIPGDSIYSVLPPGSTLMQPSKSPVSIDELISTFKEIADNVNTVTSSLKETVASQDSSNNINAMIENAQRALKSFETLAENTNSLVQKNESSISAISEDLLATINKMRDSLPSLCESLSSTADRIKDKLPDTISNIDRDMDEITKAITDVGGTITGVGGNINDTITPVKGVFNKINRGKGVLGSLITDEELSRDLRDTLDNMRSYYSYMGRISVNIDAHLESMQGRGNDLDFKDSKGYFNFIVRPADDFYYLIGATSSYAGNVKFKRTDSLWFDETKNEYVPKDLQLDDWAKLNYASVKEEYTREFGALTINMQFAKELEDLCFRLGLFESTFGFGLDYKLPLEDKFKWVSSFEIFRFNEFMTHTLAGRVIADIDMPHLKWYNRIFFNDALYFVFGADDFISKFNKNFFVGMGMSFEQNDMKYLASKIK